MSRIPNLVHRFHCMEVEHGLFKVGQERQLPIWDIVRYQVYLRYYYDSEVLEGVLAAPARSGRHYINLFKELLRFGWKLVSTPGKNIVMTVSLATAPDGRRFDKAAQGVMEVLGHDRLVLESMLAQPIANDYVYNFSFVFQRIFRGERLLEDWWRRIEIALVKSLGDARVTYEDLDLAYHQYQSDQAFYGWLFRRKRPERVFIADGNPKAMLWAARSVSAKTYLVQHQGIEIDEIDFSYPPGIDRNSNILFADHVLTMGSYWCRGINVPAKSICAVGNDCFYNRPDAPVDGSLLIVSSMVHGGFLSQLTLQLAQANPAQRFVFKLHPTEAARRAGYDELFKSHGNVSVVLNEIDINLLIAQSQLVILIVSGVLYEALNQGKKVAIYKRLNYERQVCVAGMPNVFFFDDAHEVPGILRKNAAPPLADFYKPLDRELLLRTIGMAGGATGS